MNTSQIRALLTRQQSLNQQQHKRLARRIHDQVSQKMTLLTLQLSLASSEDNVPENWAEKCRDWAGLVMELGQTIRDITNELQPGVVDDQGLSGALRWFALHSAGAVQCAVISPAREISLDPFAANELVAICRELVTEILGPAGVTRAEIELQQKEGSVRVQLRAIGEAGRDLLSETALSALAVRERMLSMEGSVELTALAGGPAVTLVAPASLTSDSPDQHQQTSQPLPAT